MSRRMTYLRATKNEEAGMVCAAWVPRSGSVTDGPASFVLLGRGHGEEKAVAVAEYKFESDTLSDAIHAMETEDGSPLKLAVHPKGDAVICAFAENCKLFEMDTKGKVKLKASERELPELQGIGLQNRICFSGDGSLFAAGGKDGHLRVFTWPAFQLVFEKPHAHRSIQDLDISLDSAYIATSWEDACIVWEIKTGESVAQLQRNKDEKFGYCRWSRDGTRAFLFVSYAKNRKGCVGVWDMVDWKKIGYKKLADAPISALAVSQDGKSLGLGTTEGDVAVIKIKSMEASQLIGNAHNEPVSALEFSKHGRALLSVGADATGRVSQLKRSEWKEWQLYSLFFGLILVSGLLFWAFFESTLSDNFWQFPLGRAQPARPPPEAIWGYYQEPEGYGRDMSS